MAFVGIELKGLEDIYKEPFTFPDLDRELSEGVLSKVKHPLYCFMGAQREQNSFDMASTKFIETFFESTLSGRNRSRDKGASSSLHSGDRL